MNSDNSEKIIVVTGASGYIGSHIVRLLFERGYRVRGVVRDLHNEEKLAFLRALPRPTTPEGDDPLELVEADLQDGKYGAILQGAHALIHTATPYLHSADDPLKEIVEPAVAGTVDAIRGALEAGVRRVVVTSSGGAVFSIPPPSPGYLYTEKDWNMQSSLTNNPYFYSKRLAEQAAWKLWEENKDRLDLVVVNPGFVLGPPQSAVLNTSLKLVINYLLGKVEKPMPFRFPVVDVRDAALAHVLALEQDAAIGHRVFCGCDMIAGRDLALKLKELFPEYPNVKDVNVDTGVESYFDTSLLKSLGLREFIPFDQMVKDMVEQLIKVGALEDLRQKQQ